MKSKMLKLSTALIYPLLFLVLISIFQLNIINTTSEFQFKTYRDGSEALVLGKLFADENGISTPNSNLGFIEKDISQIDAGVLSVYERIENLSGISPLNITDQYWTNGFSNTQSAFVLGVANANVIGYMPDELVRGQKIEFLNGGIREVIDTNRQGNYLNVSYSGARIDGSEHEWPNTIKPLEKPTYLFDPYRQQFGVQGLVLSWVYTHIPLFTTVFSLQLLMAAALAATLLALAAQLSRSVSPLFGAIFIMTMIGSPWIVAIARNLYWVSFLWFLPAVFATMIYTSKQGSYKRSCLYILYFIAIVLKCLAGYEYITSIVILSLCILMVDPFRESPRYTLTNSIKSIFTLGLLSILGFSTAIILHADNRADTIAQGIEQTFSLDALKYSYLGKFAGSGQVGPGTPLLEILSKYVTEWNTPVVFWFQATSAFTWLIIMSLASLALQFYRKDPQRKRDTALLVVTALAPLSWLVIMQRHAAVHAHLDYVLWYFGFIPSVLFVIVRGLALILGINTETKPPVGG